jgi:hypothetical protein
MRNYFTEQTNFYKGNDPEKLLKEFGSPLYVYNEAILRERCRDMAGLVSYPYFKSNYSIKANSNFEILKIVKEEGLHVDAMSPGEIHILFEAGAVRTQQCLISRILRSYSINGDSSKIIPGNSFSAVVFIVDNPGPFFYSRTKGQMFNLGIHGGFLYSSIDMFIKQIGKKVLVKIILFKNFDNYVKSYGNVIDKIKDMEI